MLEVLVTNGGKARSLLRGHLIYHLNRIAFTISRRKVLLSTFLTAKRDAASLEWTCRHRFFFSGLEKVASILFMLSSIQGGRSCYEVSGHVNTRYRT